MKKAKQLITISIVILLIVIISGYINADEPDNIKKKLNSLIKQYRGALNEGDINKIKSISNDQFTEKHKKMFEEIDTIYVEFFRLNDYKKVEETNKIVCNISFHYITVKQKFLRHTNEVNGKSTLTVERKGNDFLLIDTKLYEDNPLLWWILGPIIVFIFAVIPLLQMLGICPEKLRLWSEFDLWSNKEDKK